MKEVNASIITIGDELLIGQTIDTNSAFIAQELNRIGVWVKRKTTVGDIREEILMALQEYSRDMDIVIITGGLGPTADDITKPTLCEFFETTLTISDVALQNVTNIFAKLGREMGERNSKQAEVPANCIVLNNERGTAPGMWFEKDGKVFVSLPGVPHEMKGLITNSVVPKLKEKFTLPAVVHRTLLTAGRGESQIADDLVGFESTLPAHVKLAYLPAYGMVRLRLTGRGAEEASLTREIEGLFERLKGLMQNWLVADEDISIQASLKNIFVEKGKTLATAESCTGGYIAHLITSIPGSSDYFKGTVVSYANEVKENVLGVKHETLEVFGAVSEQNVKEMVAGVLGIMKTDYAIATSGIMGPGGGSEEKPVGTVWIAVGNQKEIKASKFHFRFDRERNTHLAANTALNMVRKFLLENS
jgi:nicotinamide-nucleotide amidase